MYKYTIVDDSAVRVDVRTNKFNEECQKLKYTIRENGNIEYWQGWFKKLVRVRFDGNDAVFVRGDMEKAKPIIQLYCDIFKIDLRVFHMSLSAY